MMSKNIGGGEHSPIGPSTLLLTLTHSLSSLSLSCPQHAAVAGSSSNEER